MQRAATEVMQSIIFSAVIDALDALKAASGGVPNQMLRDVQAMHRNATFADLPKELAGCDRPERPRRLHPALEGGLCGRPAPAMQQSRPMDRVPERDRRGRRRIADGPRAARAPRPAPEGDGPGGGPAVRRTVASAQAAGRESRDWVELDGAHAAKRRPVFSTTSMERPRGTLAGEVSPAGVFCVLPPTWAPTSIGRIECSTA